VEHLIERRCIGADFSSQYRLPWEQNCVGRNMPILHRKAELSEQKCSASAEKGPCREVYIYALYTSALHVFMYRRSFFMWYNPKTPKTDITHRLDKVHIVSSKQGQNRLLNGCVHYGLIFNSERTSFGSFKEKNNENYKWEKG